MRVYRIFAITTVVASVCVSSALSSPPSLSTRIAETEVMVWRCQDQRAVPRTQYSVSPWALPKSHAYRKWTLGVWQKRLTACGKALHAHDVELARLRYEQDWQTWLPDKWRRIGMCETQLNWQHSNSSYEGAFGFAVGSWDAFKLPGYPDAAWQASPWQQYQVALAIYHRYGFSGWGCRGA